MAVRLQYMKEKLIEWNPGWKKETVEKMPPRQLYAVYRKYAARQAQKVKAAACQPQYRQLSLKFPEEEVKEVKQTAQSAKTTPPAAQNKKELAREELRKEVLRLAGKIFEKDWPHVKTTWQFAWGQVVQDRTPGQGFLRAQIKLAKGVLTLVESNPAKVTDARNKVMMYWEAPGTRRVGQVRRANGKLEVIWFD